MSPEILHDHPQNETRSRKDAPLPSFLRAYTSLLNEAMPVLVVVRDSPPYFPPYRGMAGIITADPLTSLQLRLNQPLLTLLDKLVGDLFSWSPIWWKDDAEPYGRIILWRDHPKGRTKRHRIKTKGRESVTLRLFGPRNAQLWFPDPTITHYAVTEFTTRHHGFEFNPLDGFQQSFTLGSFARHSHTSAPSPPEIVIAGGAAEPGPSAIPLAASQPFLDPADAPSVSKGQVKGTFVPGSEPKFLGVSEG